MLIYTILQLIWRPRTVYKFGSAECFRLRRSANFSRLPKTSLTFFVHVCGGGHEWAVRGFAASQSFESRERFQNERARAELRRSRAPLYWVSSAVNMHIWDWQELNNKKGKPGRRWFVQVWAMVREMRGREMRVCVCV